MKRLIEYTKQFLIEYGTLILGGILGALLGELILKLTLNIGIFSR